MKILLNYNFNPKDIINEDFKLLFEKKRRDSTFAFVYEKNGLIYAIRDHLGIVPLYYRYREGNFRFSINFSDLVKPDDKINDMGLRSLLALGTSKLFPLIEGINIVPPGSVIEIDKASGKTRVLFQYKIKPRKISVFVRMRTLVEEVEKLLLNAMKRLVKYGTVGLFLSGGTDSTLVGIYLRKLGINVNAYTSVQDDKDVFHTKQSANIIGVKKHYIDYPRKQKELFLLVPKVYGIPHGRSTGMAVASLWENTPLRNEKQVFFGSNCDTMLCSVPQEYLIYFIHFLPKFIRKKIGLPFNDMLKNYVYCVSKGFVNDYREISRLYDKLTPIQLITLAGMLIGHYVDTEMFGQPALQRKILISNPFYDMDLIEFCMGIPFLFRLGVSLEPKFDFMWERNFFKKLFLRLMILSFEKHIIFKIMSKYCKTKMSKRGFILPPEKDLIRMMPLTIFGIDLARKRNICNIRVSNEQIRITAGVLKRWCEMNGLEKIS